MSDPSCKSPAAQRFTVVLGDGLEEEILSPLSRHLASRWSIGAREIERLCGRGAGFGRGPLPTFLRLASSAGNVRVILLTTVDPGAGAAAGTNHFPPPLDGIVGACRVVVCQHGRIPTEALRAAILEQTGCDPLTPASGSSCVRFLVVGCHTEERVLALAMFLRRVFHSDDVAVASHLVGSATQVAHMAVLRHTLPGLGVRVLLDLAEAARFAGLDPAALSDLAATPCSIQPEELRDALNEDQRRIIELLCLHWTRASLRPLTGGFSGSLLLLADGWKGDARTEPMVLKVDAFLQMRRELSGYYLVKDLLGKHVPTFGYPVTAGDHMGVGMELAAMEGHPKTLQDTFESAEDDASTSVFLNRLDKTLELLSDRLYRNTLERGWIVPYRDFGLHAKKQVQRLRENAELALGYQREAGLPNTAIDLDQLAGIFRLITANDAGVDGNICLTHGDLNFANVIFDEGDNAWLIDWTHCGWAPPEHDFAKLENDVKFVMSKSFELEDLPRLRKLEQYLVEQRVPADVDGLPDGLRFVKWDLRYRRLLHAVRRIRSACFKLVEGEEWIVYRIALLRYAAHTLSFDARRGRGECDVAQLAYALESVEHLAFNLVSDLFHLRIRTERAQGYPPRQRIAIEEAPWAFACPDYSPPYHVDPTVLANERPNGWADPEDFRSILPALRSRPAKFRDADGRPLNPRGRSGMAGRGLLGSWGRNVAVAGVLIRPTGVSNALEVLLGREASQSRIELPKSFLRPGEEPQEGVARVVAAETGCRPGYRFEVVSEDYTYDSRQTDHAWVETQVLLFFDADGSLPDLPVAGGDFVEVAWQPLDAATINGVPSGQVGFLRVAIEHLKNTGRLEAAAAESLLASTG